MIGKHILGTFLDFIFTLRGGINSDRKLPDHPQG